MIDRQDAIDILKANYPDACFEQLREAVDVAIIALQSAEPERKTEKLIEEINKMDRLYLNIQDGEIRVLPYDNVIRIIQRTEPERKTGKWIYHPEIKNIYGGKCIECSECGEKYMVMYIEDEKYCRNCGSHNGAKMEEQE